MDADQKTIVNKLFEPSCMSKLNMNQKTTICFLICNMLAFCTCLVAFCLCGRRDLQNMTIQTGVLIPIYLFWLCIDWNFQTQLRVLPAMIINCSVIASQVCFLVFLWQSNDGEVEEYYESMVIQNLLFLLLVYTECLMFLQTVQGIVCNALAVIIGFIVNYFHLTQIQEKTTLGLSHIFLLVFILTSASLVKLVSSVEIQCIDKKLKQIENAFKLLRTHLSKSPVGFAIVKQNAVGQNDYSPCSTQNQEGNIWQQKKLTKASSLPSKKESEGRKSVMRIDHSNTLLHELLTLAQRGQSAADWSPKKATPLGKLLNTRMFVVKPSESEHESSFSQEPIVGDSHHPQAGLLQPNGLNVSQKSILSKAKRGPLLPKSSTNILLSIVELIVDKEEQLENQPMVVYSPKSSTYFSISVQRYRKAGFEFSHIQMQKTDKQKITTSQTDQIIAKMNDQVNKVSLQTFKDVETIVSQWSENSFGKEKLVKLINLHLSYNMLLLRNLQDLQTLASSKRLPEVMEMIDVKQVLKQVTDQVRIRFSTRVQLDFQFDQVESKIIGCDKSRLQQIFMALLTNAVKFSPHHGEQVRIKAKVQPDQKYTNYLSVRVYNKGVGIELAEIEQLFKPFFKSQRKECLRVNSDGIGLGLFTARSIAQQLGGDITFMRKADQVNCFELKIVVRDHSSIVDKSVSSNLQSRNGFSDHNIFVQTSSKRALSSNSRVSGAAKSQNNVPLENPFKPLVAGVTTAKSKNSASISDIEEWDDDDSLEGKRSSGFSKLKAWPRRQSKRQKQFKKSSSRSEVFQGSPKKFAELENFT